jgi:hypothetical protein
MLEAMKKNEVHESWVGLSSADEQQKLININFKEFHRVHPKGKMKGEYIPHLRTVSEQCLQLSTYGNTVKSCLFYDDLFLRRV